MAGAFQRVLPDTSDPQFAANGAITGEVAAYNIAMAAFQLTGPPGLETGAQEATDVATELTYLTTVVAAAIAQGYIVRLGPPGPSWLGTAQNRLWNLTIAKQLETAAGFDKHYT